MSKQTAVQFYEKEYRELTINFERGKISIGEYAVKSLEIYNQALAMEREQMIDLVESLKDYTKESHTVLGYDVRESSELVGMYFTQTFKPNE